MENDTQSLIKQAYMNLPQDVQQAINNTDLAGKFSAIAEKHGLHVDQNGSLQTETILVMIGLEPAGDYVDNIQKELDISRNEAQSIAEDVNKEILDSIRVSLRKIQEDSQDTADQELFELENEAKNTLQHAPLQSTAVSSVEKAGGFTIEQNTPPAASQYNDSDLKKEDVLQDIENIGNFTKADGGAAFVDHLLSNPIVSKQEVKTEIPKKAEEPLRAPGTDPYRESVE